MLEKAIYGSRQYYMLLGVIGLLILVGAVAYANQFINGLQVTGLSRDVPWGLYIAQFTFLVGVAASAVMVVLPYYVHDYKAFGRMTILGEFLAIPAVIMCIAFIGVDMGQVSRAPNMALHPTFNSVMFWDATVLFGYLVINVVISQVTFGAERKGLPPPKWIKPIIYLSIPWAVSIHTVTAFLYSGLAARPFWMTAILAPRFLASAFAAGPAILILLALIVRHFTSFDPGKKALHKLSQIITYAMLANVFFILLEIFTAAYSNIPEHMHHFAFMYLGLEGNSTLAPWMFTSSVLAIVALVLLMVPKWRTSEIGLPVACAATIASLWIEKGLSLVITGFVPNPMDKVVYYWPSLTEVGVAVGVYAIGAGILVVLYKIAISVREELAGGKMSPED